MIVLVNDSMDSPRSPSARVGQHRCYHAITKVGAQPRLLPFIEPKSPRQGPLRPCPGFEPSFSSLLNALFHFLQGNETRLSSVDLPLPRIENLLMPLRHWHLTFVLR